MKLAGKLYDITIIPVEQKNYSIIDFALSVANRKSMGLATIRPVSSPASRLRVLLQQYGSSAISARRLCKQTPYRFNLLN